MWIRYTTAVSYVSLLIGYGAGLLLGWALAQGVPGVVPADSPALVARCAALCVIAWPIWFLHWRWARRDWQWDSHIAQYFLACFTLIGLVASCVVGAQFITRLFELLLSVRPLGEDSTGFLFGALWSTAISLWMWIYHGRIWLEHRRRARDTRGMAPPPSVP
jgi:hypothetical protein